MKGFFLGKDYTRKRVIRGRNGSSPSPTTTKTGRTVKASQISTDPCEVCGLYKNCSSPKMAVTGEGRKGILIIAEAPGKEEDENWERLGYKKPTQLIGKAGKLLREILSKYGIDLDKDCWKTNAVNCRPPDNREPTGIEINCCSARVWETIRTLKPEFIWLLGGTAIKALFRNEFSTSYLSMAAWRKRCIPYRKTDSWVIPLYHPSFLLRSGNNELVESFFHRDIKWAISCLKRGRVKFEDDPSSKIRIVKDFKEMQDLLKQLKSVKEMVFDYETTGLNPLIEGQKILSTSVCFNTDVAYSFPVQYPHWTEEQFEYIKNNWKEVLLSQSLKIAQGCKFEHLWTVRKYDIRPVWWGWDTMIASHILDEGRGKTTKLEMQAFWRWGFEDHGKRLGITPLKEYDDGKGFNKLHTAKLDDLLEYGGIDAYEEYLLYKDQKVEFKRKEDLRRAYALSFKGMLAFADSEEFGVPVDDEYYQSEDKRIKEEVKRIEEELISGRHGKRFTATQGRKINLDSPKDLQILLFDIMGEEPIRKLKTGFSTDKDTLLKINNSFTNDLLRLKRLKKIRSTYLSQFLRYSVGGRIHPSTNLHIARTFRSSMDKPNLQNIPIREKEARNICRGGIVPSPGNMLMEVDYHAIEVRGLACCSHDPVLINEVSDPNTDMHRDQAGEIFMFPISEVTKDIRQLGKNDFVFPEFYGDWYKQCAKSIWEDVIEQKLKTASGVPLLEHLASKGISTFAAFERHMKDVEDKFWNTLKVSDHWRREIVIGFYKQCGYIGTHFGYRRGGYLKANMLMNTPVQNIASCLLLWSYVKINEIRKSEGWKTRLLLQVHDSILFDLFPAERDYVIGVVRKVMCEDVRKEFPFIIVPLEVEIEMAGINQPWSKKEKFNEGKRRRITS